MTDEISETILNIRTEVLRYAAASNHNHDSRYVIGNSDNFAPKNHASTNNEYGVGNTTQYGHVLFSSSDISDDDTSKDNCAPSIQSVKKYVKSKVNSVNGLEGQTIASSSTGITYQSTDNQIPTAKAVYNAINNIDLFSQLSQHTITNPKDVTTNIDNIVTTGYYHKTNNGSFTHAPNTVYYTDGLIHVQRYGTRAVQTVYATVQNNNNNYRFNGEIYTRFGTISSSGNVWSKWHVLHKPWTERSDLIGTLGTGVDSGSVTLWENTAGYTIRWKQTQNNQNYTVSGAKYTYTPICSFSRDLPLKGPFVFGNIINNMDIKIQADGMYLRTTENVGGVLPGIDETYFVPRVN